MSKYKTILYEINQINNEEFNTETLRNIQLLYKKINHYYKEKELTKLEVLNLYIKYRKLTNNKLKEIYPENYKTLSKTINEAFYQDYNQVPTDLTIIDNDLTLLYNKSYDNPYEKDKIKILNNKNYKELPNEHSLYTFRNCYYSIYQTTEKDIFETFYNFYFPHTYDQNKPSLQILIDYINMLLKPYNNDLDKSIEYSIKKGQIIYPKNSTMKIFINIPLRDIIVSIYNNKTIIFNLVAIDEWNEIHSYKITQIPKQNRFYSWNMKRIQLGTWNLSKSLEKQNVLTKKKTKTDN